jgi:hypothetical protein
MKSYRQSLPMRAFRFAFNVLGSVWPFFYILKSIFDPAGFFSLASPLLVFFALFFSIMPAILIIFTANYFPDIEIDQANIYISFLWRKIPIPLSEVVAIKPAIGLSQVLSETPAQWVVGAREISRFHILYGLMYGLWRHPSFIITNSVAEFDQLISRIGKMVDH